MQLNNVNGPEAAKKKTFPAYVAFAVTGQIASYLAASKP
jgi:hypothetical protein